METYGSVWSMATATRAGSTRLTAETWTGAALEAIAEGGLAAVTVEGLARRLGATKGSFHRHFNNRDALIEATLAAWEAGETVEVAKMLAPLPDAASRLWVRPRAALDDRPGARVGPGCWPTPTSLSSGFCSSGNARPDRLPAPAVRADRCRESAGSGNHRVRHLPWPDAHAPSRRFQHPARGGTGPLRGPDLRLAHPRRVLSEFSHHGVASRLGRHRADLHHQVLDPVIVAGPWRWRALRFLRAEAAGGDPARPVGARHPGSGCGPGARGSLTGWPFPGSIPEEAPFSSAAGEGL